MLGVRSFGATEQHEGAFKHSWLTSEQTGMKLAWEVSSNTRLTNDRKRRCFRDGSSGSQRNRRAQRLEKSDKNGK